MICCCTLVNFKVLSWVTDAVYYTSWNPVFYLNFFNRDCWKKICNCSMRKERFPISDFDSLNGTDTNCVAITWRCISGSLWRLETAPTEGGFSTWEEDGPGRFSMKGPRLHVCDIALHLHLEARSRFPAQVLRRVDFCTCQSCLQWTLPRTGLAALHASVFELWRCVIQYNPKVRCFWRALNKWSEESHS